MLNKVELAKIIDKKLPKKTLAVTELLEDLIEIEKQYEKSLIKARVCIEKEWEVLTQLISIEDIKTLLGSDDINEVDINEVSIILLHILNTYNSVVLNEKIKVNSQFVNSSDLKKVIDVADKAQTIISASNNSK